MGVTRQNVTFISAVGGIALGVPVARTVDVALGLRILAFLIVAVIVTLLLRAVLRRRIAYEERRR